MTARWPLIASPALYGVSMLLPTYEKGSKTAPGFQAFTGCFEAFAEAWPFALGSIANVVYGLALAAALPARAASQALALVGLLAAVVCSLTFFPELQLHPGWWVWTASFALLAGRRGVSWPFEAATDARGDALRALVLAVPVAAVPIAVLAPHADRWAPAGLLVPPVVALVVSCAGAAFVGVLACRFAPRYFASSGTSRNSPAASGGAAGLESRTEPSPSTSNPAPGSSRPVTRRVE